MVIFFIELDIPDILTPVTHDTDPPRDLAHQFIDGMIILSPFKSKTMGLLA
jgi:hypothetical protein